MGKLHKEPMEMAKRAKKSRKIKCANLNDWPCLGLNQFGRGNNRINLEKSDDTTPRRDYDKITISLKAVLYIFIFNVKLCKICSEKVPHPLEKNKKIILSEQSSRG